MPKFILITNPYSKKKDVIPVDSILLIEECIENEVEDYLGKSCIVHFSLGTLVTSRVSDKDIVSQLTIIRREM
jgi:hypothetical protein